MDNNINSFTFYRDYFNLIDTIPEKNKKELLCAIVDYVFKDKEPNLDGHDKAIFNTLKSQLNVSKCNSKRKTKTEPKENQNKSEIISDKEPKVKPKENKTSILSFKFYISNFKFLNNRELLKNKIEEWVKYKLERKELYKETGFNTLLKQIQKNVELYGEEKVIELIDECMANNYKGIIFEKLKEKGSKKIVSAPSWFNENLKSEEEMLNDEDKQLIERVKNGI